MSDSPLPSTLSPRSGDPYIDRHLPSPGSFEDRIYAVLMNGSTDEGDMGFFSLAAHDLLAMPEMQAIRDWIAERAREVVDDGWTARQALGQLPASVVDWLLRSTKGEPK